MLNNIIFIADFFYRDYTGGAELNDYSLIERFKKKGITIKEIYCRNVSVSFLEQNKDQKFIIANFVSLGNNEKNFLMKNCDYIIYEHDHKYLKKRNPISYKNFVAPNSELANYEFYKNAKSVVCLTNLAMDVLKLNLKIENVTKVDASVWLDEDLDYMLSLSKNKKNNKYAIMDSDNSIKKRQKSIEYCKKNNIEYELIKDKNHRKFLEKLSQYKGLVFMTGHLETCCRLVVEAKMMNCKVITQTKLIGAASEDWFSLNGEQLVEKIRNISNKSPDLFLKNFKDK